MDIVGKKGYKKTGYFSGLIGTIAKGDGVVGFEHLYKIVFKNGSAVMASKKDIQVIEE
ncbi:hypothetical protein JCM17380_24310 [Desulfosporosinus burensis]